MTTTSRKLDREQQDEHILEVSALFSLASHSVIKTGDSLSCLAKREGAARLNNVLKVNPHSPQYSPSIHQKYRPHFQPLDSVPDKSSCTLGVGGGGYLFIYQVNLISGAGRSRWGRGKIPVNVPLFCPTVPSRAAEQAGTGRCYQPRGPRSKHVDF